MHDLLHLGSGEELEERLERGERLGVDHRLDVPGRDLHDPELDEERPFAHELGVERERARGLASSRQSDLEVLLLFDDPGGSGRIGGFGLSVA